MFVTWLIIGSAILVNCTFFTLRCLNHSDNNSSRCRWVGLIVFNLLGLLFICSLAWPLTPWGLQQRELIVEGFLQEFKAGNIDEALKYFTRYPLPDYAADDADSLRDELHYPVSWEFEHINNRRHIFNGTVSYADGETTSFFVGLEWQWEKLQWGISMTRFGSVSNNKSRGSVILFDTLPAYYNLGRSAILWGFASVFLFWRLIERDKKRD